MIRNIGMGGADNADVVDGLRGVFEEFADFDAALAVFFELERRRKSCAGFAFGFWILEREHFARVFFDRGEGIKLFAVGAVEKFEALRDGFAERRHQRFGR